MSLLADILGRIETRYVFVVGKGGVGKTTTAGAVALGTADRGEATLLLSTDPAHSLSDLFQVGPTGGGVAPSGCAPSLFLQELDAGRVVNAWLGEARAGVRELLDRGTYLDAEDVDPFLDLTLPGMDEVAGLIRLVELADDNRYDRVVVDTAPTGHALRLMRTDTVMASWHGALGAMADKVRAVAEQLARRSVALDADVLIHDLRLRVDRYREDVLGSAAAVVVGRSGAVVEAETERLHQALEELGFSPIVRLHVDEPDAAARSADGPAGVAEIPYREDLVGCEGLRRWGHSAPGKPGAGVEGTLAHGPASSAAETLAAEPAAAADILAEEPATSTVDTLPADPAITAIRSFQQDVLFFVGKGGVGKSTCAAAWSLALARDRPVTLMSVDPAGSLGEILAGEDVPGLRVLQIEADRDFEAFRRAYRQSVQDAFQRLSGTWDAALDRRVVESLLDLAPSGMDEIFAVSALMDEMDAGRTVVVDTPPTGHFLRLVALPGYGLEWTRELMRVLVKYRAALGLDAFAERLLHFAKRLKRLKLELSDPDRSGAVLVLQRGPLVAAESRRLRAGLEEVGVALLGVVANREPARDSSYAVASAESGTLRIHAPRVDPPPVGADALQAFLAQWSAVR